ncbi:MAG: alanine racemase [Patescibacteria group bacterium]
MQKKHPLSYIEISKANVIYNIKQFRRIVKEGTKIAAVVKANAYGHGDRAVVSILAPYVDYFQVNSVEELETIRAVTKKPVLLLGYVQKSDLARVMSAGCILSVFDLPHALAINEASRKLKIIQKVHIAIDAHLGREGLLPSQVEKFLAEIKKMKNISIDGIYAHFANIEDSADLSHAEKQIKAFKDAIQLFKEPAGKQGIKTHISATSGVLAYEKWKGIHPIVRIGIGLYGMWPSGALEKMWQKKISLKPALRYVTRVASLKELPAGESIGYGLSYVTTKKTDIVVIPQGYSNGIPRSASNKGSVLIRGKRAPILGRIAMNMFVVDVTDIKGAKAEDEAVIIGSQKGQSISAEEWAEKTQTINYEVTTRLSALLPRIIV